MKIHIVSLTCLFLCESALADTFYIGGYGYHPIANHFGTSIIQLAGDTGAIAIDQGGTIYGSVSSYSIYKFGSGGYLDDLFSYDGAIVPYALAFDPVGRLCAATTYGSSSGAGRIVKYGPNGTPYVFASTAYGYSGYFASLAFDRAGNLYASQPGTNTIWKYTPDGVGSIFARTGLNQPDGLAFDSAGDLYVSNVAGNTITKFDPAGIGSFFASTYNPLGIAFDSAGYLYAVDGVDTMTRFAPDGSSSVFATGLDSPVAVAITPEPTAWVLLILSLSAFASRRRRIQPTASLPNLK